MNHLRFLFSFGLLFSLHPSYTQCPFDPIITGDSLLCPGEDGRLLTQSYESIQWYRRLIFEDTAMLISDATDSSIVVQAEVNSGFYYSVEATQDGCTERSPEVLVDSYTFLPPFVSHSGIFESDGSGGFLICPGDTLFSTLGLPYDTLIHWFKDGLLIPEAANRTIPMFEPGIYTVEGAPTLCPNFIQPLGLTIDVAFADDCMSMVSDPNLFDRISLYPNPVKTTLYVQNANGSPITGFRIWKVSGELLKEQYGLSAFDFSIDFETAPKGVFFVELQLGIKKVYVKVSK
ncbi:MAG: hypothetical protein DHS20C18_23030 [Saprospiraceae bacterium]|nr:MAG: hypothetical protein DHS20C18_23030 [Saprospiraceae bacterium]